MRRTWPILVSLLLVLAASGRPSVAQSLPGAGHDADQPIEINADSLEVQQDKQIAVFRGNVDAIQGAIRLKADELKVYYRTGGSSADLNGAIVRIDALGRVFISSPSETAQGDAGVYDVAGKQITLTGSVVLTRGQNVIRGQRLVMNMETGLSLVEGGGPGGRVRGLFVPSEKPKR